MRIAKYLASCGIASRRKAEELISAGKIKVNDEIVTDLGRQVYPPDDKVNLEDTLCEPIIKKYYLLNKPTGYTSSLSDPHAKKLISELVPEEPLVWPVGRLDVETSGLIILTNDGDLTQKLTHPSFLKEKEYVTKSNFDLTKNEIESIQNGIVLEDGPIKPDLFEKIATCTYRIVIHEGRNRLIRRIFEHIGKKVVHLERTRIQFLNDRMQPGTFRELTKEEVTNLLTNTKKQ